VCLVLSIADYSRLGFRFVGFDDIIVIDLFVIESLKTSGWVVSDTS